jgi:2-keto-4-pentenoate hydratase/2-oxohepta-3-ene-1,7-dioic acid hydratase in catechol pathway
MKLARCLTTGGETVYGSVQPDGSVRRVVGDIFGSHTVLTETVAVAKLLSPVAAPPNVICIGLNYRKHAEESKLPVPKAPLIFMKNSASVCNPGDEILIPHMAPNEVDYECELAIVIGRPARNVKKAQAQDYVLGYTCANDVSARDCQKGDGQWVRAKSFDRFCPLGPYLVKGDGFNPDNTGIRTRLNGNVMQDSNTNDLIFDTSTIIEYLSANYTLLPGTVILTGTPYGVGFARTPPVFMKAGDVVEIEIDGIGVLKNPVAAEAKPA